ncbi:FAD-dependent monooxygenase [Kribbella sp. CA-247076]|uniref:FAD-dependent monooxygenase n=1 Tax=Kribbella sp. CA-247076 TaxID=3239941 RepID=UPI003D8DC6C0
MTDVDVIVVGGAPTGLMLAGELRLAGVRVVVLERQPRPRETAKANGLAGQILDLLRYRGLLERFEAVSTDPHPPARFPFGGMDLDFTHLTDPPLRAIQIPQARLEAVLAERARELGADVRRGHQVTGLDQTDGAVTVQVSGPDGPYHLTARYLVGCDGPRSRVRDLAGIAFPGTTYPEVNRLAQVTVHESVTRLGNGDLDVPGAGTIPAGFSRTGNGVFGLGALTDDVLMVYTSEDETAEYDDDVPLTLAELRDSIRRVLGKEVPLGEPHRLSRFTFHARQAERYRAGRVFVAGDAAHLFPATGVALNAGMLDAVNLAWKLAADVQGRAPDGLLDTYHTERHYAGARTLVHTRAQVALRRGLDPAADALREVFQELLAEEAPLRRLAGMVAGTDIRYPLPGAGDHGLIGTFAPDLTLHTEQGTTTVAELMRSARPVLLDLADSADVRQAAANRPARVDVVTAKTDDRPADVLLIRPDAVIAWAADLDQSNGVTAPLCKALSTCGVSG